MKRKTGQRYRSSVDVTTLSSIIACEQAFKTLEEEERQDELEDKLLIALRREDQQITTQRKDWTRRNNIARLKYREKRRQIQERLDLLKSQSRQANASQQAMLVKWAMMDSL